MRQQPHRPAVTLTLSAGRARHGRAAPRVPLRARQSRAIWRAAPAGAGAEPAGSQAGATQAGRAA
eukprot:11148043-Lingulodinium_polyedra.AAC.1